MAKSFGFESTADEVLEGIDLSGQRVLITGVSAGLGVETVRAIVAHVTVLGGSPAPAVVLLVLSGMIAYLRKA